MELIKTNEFATNQVLPSTHPNLMGNKAACFLHIQTGSFTVQLILPVIFNCCEISVTSILR